VARSTVGPVITWSTAARSIRALRERRARALARWRSYALARRRRRGQAGHADPFGGIEFVIVDVETTGWTPEEAAITEIGAVLVRAGQICGQFSCLVNPGTAIPPQVAALTGIDDAMVAPAPPLPAALTAFLSFARDCVLTAHNAPFDLGFLTAACRASGLPWPGFRVLDTADLARRLLRDDEVPDCKLATLAEFFHARTRPVHRALPDALATADVLTALLDRLAASGARTLAEAGLGYTAASPAAAMPAAAGTSAGNGAARAAASQPAARQPAARQPGAANGAASPAGGPAGRAATDATPGTAQAC
jgi:DNA polymerase III epsilon subunit family exonuclease